jgi:integral membrane sensor domain MASE1
MDSLVSALPTRERHNGLRRDDLPRTIRNSVIVAIAYYLGAELAFLIGTLSDRIFAPFWPPNVVLFCALLVTPLRRWWIFILAAFPAHILANAHIGMPARQLLVPFPTNCSVAALNAFAVQRIMSNHSGSEAFERRRPMFSLPRL